MLINLKSFYSPNALVYGTGREPIQGTIYVADGSIRFLHIVENTVFIHTTMGQFKVVEEDAKTLNENTNKLLNMVNYGNTFGDVSDDLR